MSVFPPLLAFDWGDLIYGLIPVLWIISQFLGNKEDKEKKEESTPDDAEVAERRRRIQEEIRRRIEERKAAAEGRPVQAPEAAFAGDEPRPAEPRERPRYDPTQPERPSREPARPVMPTPAPVSRPAERPVELRPQVAASERADSGQSIEARLAEQRERLAESEKAHLDAQKRAARIARQHIADERDAADIAKPLTHATAVRAQVLASLASPAQARAAIVLGEILGPAMGNREEIGRPLF